MTPEVSRTVPEPGLHRCWRGISLALCLSATALASWAQYKVIGPDGKVTYTDQPPTERAAQALPAAPAAPARSASPLPAALATLAARYPVMLYSAPQCRPCDAGRQYLVQRGVPFQERTVTTAADARAFSSLGANNTLPMLTIGQQRLTGWVSADWASYLDAAGYPATSQLPGAYSRPAATPLAPAKAPSAPADNPPAYEDIRRPMPEDPNAGRPPGGPSIRF